MPTFGYLAFDASGKQVKGSMDGDSREQIIRELKFKGLTPVKVESQNLLTRDISFEFGGVKTKELAIFCRQFVSISKAGVPIIQNMQLLSEQTENKVLANAIKEIVTDIEKGETLTSAMEKHKKVFPNLLITTVGAGEASGNLDMAFERMAVQLEKTALVEDMIKKAMVYPIMVLIVAVGVVGVMLIVVIPSYTDMFDQLGTELPAITQMVVDMSDFVIAKWYLIIAVVAAVIIFFKWFQGTSVGQMTLGRLQMKLPIVGDLTQKKACSNLSRTMSTLFASGVSIVDSIDITARTMDNILYKNALTETKDAVIAGQPMSIALENTKMFPPMMYHMIRIGEESGSTDEMLEKLAEYYDQEVEAATAALMAAMEPLIIIVLAGVVGFLIAAIMSPMMTMYESLDNL
ncbi:MAG: type II secretion system F family protein [Butyrivibrio sp.]|uniref:type II secretion system F family protein n=1 Tax=Butyrivibrio sp. TaxID=28121 RepID=UPI0025D0C55A|nr:type II secretion system F family protein [Butyrivibrio sp.]MCR5771652.1 type II secretion system F family protein [Butyrivibrio sp.]